MYFAVIAKWAILWRKSPSYQGGKRFCKYLQNDQNEDSDSQAHCLLPQVIMSFQIQCGFGTPRRDGSLELIMQPYNIPSKRGSRRYNWRQRCPFTHDFIFSLSQWTTGLLHRSNLFTVTTNHAEWHISARRGSAETTKHNWAWFSWWAFAVADGCSGLSFESPYHRAKDMEIFEKAVLQASNGLTHHQIHESQESLCAFPWSC